MGREKAKTIIEGEGGKISDVVSKKIDILIVGTDPGSKLKKARELGIEIWDEEKFISVINEKKVN
jgi:DNA ligase (NAD+)